MYIQENFELAEGHHNYSHWTIMYYMASDNKYSSKTFQLVDNLTKIDSNADINTLILIDGNETNDSRVYIINEGAIIDLSEKFGLPSEVDSSSSRLLEKFCRYSMNNYPAEHYALFIISPCFGWQGMCPDFQDSNYFNFEKHLMNIIDFREVLKNITKGNKIDILSIDGCLGSMIEIAYEIYPYVDYMIATEADNAPLKLWPNGDSNSKISRKYKCHVSRIHKLGN